MLDEMALLAAYFGEIGVGIGYSDKGNYFRDTLLRFGGLREAGQFIKAGATRSILDKFMSKANAGDGSVIFLTNDQRAYLSLNAIIGSLGDEKQAADLADKLVGQRVLQRGYIFQCERCRLSSWYSIDVLTADFVCNRCSFRQQFTRTHWKQPVEPHWYFRLAETVYQFYANNSHLTAQALYKLQSESTLAFHYVPEIDLIDFPKPGEKREMDIACVVDGQMILGECKTEPLRPKDAAKFETLVARLHKRPDRIVFATSLPDVTDDFKARISNLQRPRVLTFADMYDA